MSQIKSIVLILLAVSGLAACTAGNMSPAATSHSRAAGASSGVSNLDPVWESAPRSLGAGTAGQLWVGASEAIDLIQTVPAERGTDLIYRKSHNEGQTFGAIVPISRKPGEVSAHGENNPQLRMGPGIGIYTVFEGGRHIQFARSMSFGHSFLPPVQVNDDIGDGYHSFFTMEVSQRGEIFVAWIDGRDKATEPPGQSSIYIARSTDQGATFGANVKVSGNICPCCRPAIAFGPDGTVFMTWRHVYPDHNRTVVVAASHDGGQTWSPPVPVTSEGWKINGCAHSGPVLGMAGGHLTVAWYTAAGGRARLLMAQSADSGKTFGPAQEIQGPVLDPNHPHLSRVGQEAWILFQGRNPARNDGWGPATAWLVRVTPEGGIGSPQPLPARGGVSYPQLFPGNGGRLYAVWTELTDQGPQVMLCRGRRGPD